MRSRRVLLALAGTLLALTALPAASAGAATTYSTKAPFALWEVNMDEVVSMDGIEMGLLVKSFSPGMNIVRYLDRAQSIGKKVVVHFNDVIQNGTVYPSRIKPWTDKVKSHPALWGYLSVKEPSWVGVSLSEMRTLYRAFRSADPGHRVIALLGDTPHFGTSQNPWGTGVANMLWVDWYPVSCSRGYIANASLHFPKIRSYVDRVTPGTQIWLMVQAHTYYEGDKCRPSGTQLDRQVRDGFTYLKANGILFHSWYGPGYDRDLRRDATLFSQARWIVRAVRAGTF